ncbi:hypothetical protein A2U01_0092312 [Trifolium medium]|uniref:Uncharacterized protein n=1 Tax=Trifolium medium TaxID=97028 RepID=A0A392UBZ1_9FABA|nr:hypothetical protein [Trifolium medium]
MIPTLSPVGLDAPSTKIVHLSALSFEEAGAVISATNVELGELEGPLKHPICHVWSSKQ